MYMCVYVYKDPYVLHIFACTYWGMESKNHNHPSPRNGSQWFVSWFVSWLMFNID